MSNLRRPDLAYIKKCNSELMAGIQLLEKYDSAQGAASSVWSAEGAYNFNTHEIQELQRELDKIPKEVTYSTDFAPIENEASQHGSIARRINAAWKELDALITPEVLQIYWERLETIQKRFNALPADYGVNAFDTMWTLKDDYPYQQFQHGWAHWNVASWKDRPAYNLFMCDGFFAAAESTLDLREKEIATIRS